MSSGSGMSVTRVSLLETFAQLSVKLEFESRCMVLGVGSVVDSEGVGVGLTVPALPSSAGLLFSHASYLLSW